MIPWAKDRRGFTLIEIMMAVFIFGFIAVTVYGVLSRAIYARSVGEERAELYAQGRESVLRIVNDVEGALLPLSGDRIYFAGDAQRVEFVAINRGGHGLNRVRPGQVVVEYSLSDPDGRGYPQLIRGERDFQHMLDEADGVQRNNEESKFDLDDSNDIDANAPTEVFLPVLECAPGSEDSGIPGSCTRIAGMQFKFYDDAAGEWRTAWDSFEEGSGMADRIPDAVEILLVLIDEKGFEHDFYTVADLPLARANPTPGEEEDVDDGA